MPEVAFNVDSVTRCVCPSCPVQMKSNCARQLMPNLKKDALNGNPLKAEATPAAYCGGGRTSCQDFDYAKDCLCNVCPVYIQHKLKGGSPDMYYCRDGIAR